ncbi:MAG: undecaprenyldiphospho-muramoylpentapeptide beta-N-acetylglucosaminyltransferase [Candidatus Omnitrophica bacterium]|nr:undecaprenyldiphospho-muramoylpentapeptide beta-N-acetylglucosaminyltransferase [Candidatus Omnitrophota bacterium]
MKILICAAGSGGHIYPALSLAQSLQAADKNIQIFFLSNKKAISREIFKKTSDKVFIADFISPYRGKWTNPFKFFLKNLGFLLKFISETIKVFFLILSLKPDAVIGFGGIVSITAISFARLLGAPTLIHEQNIMPGQANKLLSRYVTKVAVGFKQSSKYFKQAVVFTGNPLRQDIEQVDQLAACESLGLGKNLFTILIFGGSQGSRFLNTSFTQAIAGLEHNLKHDLQIIHISGTKDVAALVDFYQQQNIQAKVFSYCGKMSVVYSAADLVIGRAGAGTINEVCFFAKPIIFIPYPYAGGHQKLNAEFMRKQGAACLLFENNLTVEHLQQDIRRLIENRDVLLSMGQKSRELFVPQSEVKLAKLVLAMIKA